jgi:hypothetical protein
MTHLGYINITSISKIHRADFNYPNLNVRAMTDLCVTLRIATWVVGGERVSPVLAGWIHSAADMAVKS